MAHVPRLYVPGRLAPGPLTLAPEQAKRLASVMRLREGDEFLVFSGDGREYRASVTAVEKKGATLRAEVGELVRQEPQSPRVVELWLGLVRANRFEWALEKCVEAGVDIIRPLVSEYTARGDAPSAAKQERWQRILVEAAEQSGRLWLPVLEPAAKFGDLLSRRRGTLILGDPGGMPWPDATKLLPQQGNIAIAIGPEGGFAPEELAQANAQGALLTRFAPHILRTETAAVIATALLRAEGV